MRLSIKNVLLVISILLSILLFSCEKKEIPEVKNYLNLEFSGINAEKTGETNWFTASMKKEGGEFTVSCIDDMAEVGVLSSIVINNPQGFIAPDPDGLMDWPSSPITYSNRKWGWAKSEYFKTDNICITTIHILPNETGATREFSFTFGCCIDYAYLTLIQAPE